jgi:hypothetical protein
MGYLSQTVSWSTPGRGSVFYSHEDSVHTLTSVDRAVIVIYTAEVGSPRRSVLPLLLTSLARASGTEIQFLETRRSDELPSQTVTLIPHTPRGDFHYPLSSRRAEAF